MILLKKLLLTLLLLISMSVEAKQNKFRVSDQDINDSKQTQINQQLVIDKYSMSSNSSIDYGAFENGEIGIMVANYYFSNSSNTNNPNNQQNPYALVYIQETFNINDRFDITLGNQTGISLPKYQSKIQIPTFHYAHLDFNYKRTTLYTGGFYSNAAYTESGYEVKNILLGGMYDLSSNTRLTVDFMGSNTLGSTVIGATYLLDGNYTLSVGGQIPNDITQNTYALLFNLKWND